VTTRRYSIAVIAGDGIGQEVVPAATAAVDAVAARHDFSINWTDFPWGSDHYWKHETMMPADWAERLVGHDAIFLGAVGSPEIPDVVTLWGLLIPIRRQFHQYVNLRPVWMLPGVAGPLAHPGAIDLVIVRENVEGEYSEIGGRLYRGRPEEAAVQETVFTRQGIVRVVRFACKLALQRRGRLVSATKSNGIVHTMPFWDEVVATTAAETPSVELRSMLVDALAAELVLKPASFDVIVASNLFGDILSDLTAALTGSIGVAASANLNPEGDYPSMFEPVHGSAPDIAGLGIADPVGQMLAATMMLDHIGQATASRDLRRAVENALASGVRTPDLGGQAGTTEFADAVIDQVAGLS
jgi:tartrate dehydrogenase/decarboxylase/D-malate dehydrogenase